MATITREFPASTGGPVPSVTFPEMKSAGTNIAIRSLSFDASTDEGCQFPWRATGYGSGNLTVTLLWYADTATSGNVVWGAAIAAITPDSDTQNIETDTWATENTATDGTSGSTQALNTTAITVSNLDSIAASDMAWLRIRRLGTSGSDTMSGDAQLVAVILSYSDT